MIVNIMIKKIKKNISFTILFTALFLLSSQTVLLAEINSTNWIKQCDDKKNCVIAINTQQKQKDSEQLVTIASAYIQIINIKDNENKKKEIILFSVNLPLNSDLKKKPLIQIDKETIGNVEYSHCNNQIGCKVTATLNEKNIKAFKDGKEFTITFGAYGVTKNYSLLFPLKGFSKAYKQL